MSDGARIPPAPLDGTPPAPVDVPPVASVPPVALVPPVAVAPPVAGDPPLLVAVALPVAVVPAPPLPDETVPPLPDETVPPLLALTEFPPALIELVPATLQSKTHAPDGAAPFPLLPHPGSAANASTDDARYGIASYARRDGNLRRIPV
ncbi:MAG TPA: hypothetical protein VH062_23150 [Polyangiaceae bacterium]|jgi:hypothetical protein|nr:hypothetical protein [Polyangiaceae bacterium]